MEAQDEDWEPKYILDVIFHLLKPPPLMRESRNPTRMRLIIDCLIRSIFLTMSLAVGSWYLDIFNWLPPTLIVLPLGLAAVLLNKRVIQELVLAPFMILTSHHGFGPLMLRILSKVCPDQFNIPGDTKEPATDEFAINIAACTMWCMAGFQHPNILKNRCHYLFIPYMLRFFPQTNNMADWVMISTVLVSTLFFIIRVTHGCLIPYLVRMGRALRGQIRFCLFRVIPASRTASSSPWNLLVCLFNRIFYYQFVFYFSFLFYFGYNVATDTSEYESVTMKLAEIWMRSAGLCGGVTQCVAVLTYLLLFILFRDILAIGHIVEAFIVLCITSILSLTVHLFELQAWVLVAVTYFNLIPLIYFGVSQSKGFIRSGPDAQAEPNLHLSLFQQQFILMSILGWTMVNRFEDELDGKLPFYERAVFHCSLLFLELFYGAFLYGCQGLCRRAFGHLRLDSFNLGQNIVWNLTFVMVTKVWFQHPDSSALSVWLFHISFVTVEFGMLWIRTGGYLIRYWDARTLLKAQEALTNEEVATLNDNCAICMIPLQPNGPQVRVTFCHHFYHSECLYEWIWIQPRCPLCNLDLKHSPVDTEDNVQEDEQEELVEIEEDVDEDPIGRGP